MFERSGKTVLVVQRRLTHYRVPFFEALRTEMVARNLRLILAYGAPDAMEAAKHDGGDLPWAHRVDTTYLLGGRVCWQPFGKLARVSDLVVVTHENKLVYNLFQQYLSRGRKLALWGHGANLQGNPASWKEWVKRRTARQADWWFGYTEASLPHILDAGFPGERVTLLNNVIDTTGLRNSLSSLTRGDVEAERRNLGLAGNNVGIYVGSLYAEKRIRFLLDVADSVRNHVPDFELVIAGDGPERSLVEAFCARHDWVKYVGMRRDRAKAVLLKLAKVMLNPGAVGLGVLDSFVSGVPLFSTDCGGHGPEMAYITNGWNGVVTLNDLTSYVNGVVGVLADDMLRGKLSAACLSSAPTYSIEKMVSNFCQGVESCLVRAGYRC